MCKYMLSKEFAFSRPALLRKRLPRRWQRQITARGSLQRAELVTFPAFFHPNDRYILGYIHHHAEKTTSVTSVLTQPPISYEPETITIPVSAHFPASVSFAAHFGTPSC